MENKLIQVAMEIILNAGDARNLCTEALAEARRGNFEEAELRMKEASEHIVFAHNSQTETIQSEASGVKHEVPLLFIHAQDTIMTITSELNMAREMINMYRFIYDTRRESTIV